MDFKYTLQETLEARFDTKTEDGIGEMQDIASHGADTGVHGFTYTHEINEFFNEFEDEIQDYYYEIFGDTWLTELSYNTSSFNELRARMVWGLIGMWCNDKIEEETMVA